MSRKLFDRRFRAFGILPLLFFTAQGSHYWQINELGHTLWMCNIGNLLLAIGIFLEEAILIRAAVLWMVPGVVVWVLYVVPTWGMLMNGRFRWAELYGVLSSTLAHIGGISVGMLALRRVRMDGRGWIYAYIWYFAVQGITRLVTSVDMNINLSKKVQPGWEQGFAVYWKFWFVLTVLVGICLWILGLVFRSLWPAANEHSPAGTELHQVRG
ncbi:MAG: hypothetical protein ABR501_12210 [Pyrinomonadaceae bacterium]